MSYSDKERQREAARERKKRQRERQRAAAVEAVRESWRQDVGATSHEPDDLEMITSELYAVRATGELKRPLDDPKSDWRTDKRKCLHVKNLYRAGGDQARADKLASCVTWLEYYEDGDGSEKTLHGMNACQSRLCPVCAKRKARRTAGRLVRVLDTVKADHKGEYHPLFLTLTVRNCAARELRATLDLLTKAWAKLRRRRSFARAVRGWFRAIEITYNAVTGEYHPHIHAILYVAKDYYADRNTKAVVNGLYIRQGKDTDVIDGYKNPTWVQMWQESLQVDYEPSVRISAVRGRKGHKHATTDEATLEAAKEAAKYATKDVDYLNPAMPEAEAVAVLLTYTAALERKRMTAMGGWIQDAADKLDVDPEDVTDLVHDDEDGASTLTAETAEYIAEYGFRFRYGDYFLLTRYANPDYQGPQGGQDDG